MVDLWIVYCFKCAEPSFKDVRCTSRNSNTDKNENGKQLIDCNEWFVSPFILLADTCVTVNTREIHASKNICACILTELQ